MSCMWIVPLLKTLVPCQHEMVKGLRWSWLKALFELNDKAKKKKQKQQQKQDQKTKATGVTAVFLNYGC